MSLTIRDFKTAALLGTCLSRDYAKETFRLLAMYQSLSASELASRIDLHIQTAQDFLEALAALGIVSRDEALEKKRPYFRYTLHEPRLRIAIELDCTVQPASASGRFRERKNAAVRFGVGRDNATISHVLVWPSDDRSGRERRINLTRAQGLFLFHLPFPTAEPAGMKAIMKKAGVEEAAATEIIDLLERLESLGVIERFSKKESLPFIREEKDE